MAEKSLPGWNTVPAAVADLANTKAAYEPGTWTEITSLGTGVKALASKPEVRLVSATKEPGSKLIEFRGEIEVEAGKSVLTTETLLTLPEGLRPASERITGIFKITATTGVVKPTATQTGAVTIKLAGLVAAL